MGDETQEYAAEAKKVTDAELLQMARNGDAMDALCTVSGLTRAKVKAALSRAAIAEAGLACMRRQSRVNNVVSVNSRGTLIIPKQLTEAMGLCGEYYVSCDGNKVMLVPVSSVPTM